MDYQALALKYPQLLLPIKHGTSGSLLYRNAVLRGMEVSGKPQFTGSPEDSYCVVHTLFGSVGILTLGNREDFEHAICALAYRCEPRPIPSSIGAQYIRGLINWEKIRAHRDRYTREGGQDWIGEFRAFTADKTNYTDSLILLSTGYYSGISPEIVGLPMEEWKKRSMMIRRNHELTHFIYRKEYPGDIDAVRDEVLADYIGIQCAFGCYDPDLARILLGVEHSTAAQGGRIRQYVSPDKLERAVSDACFWIDTLAALPRTSANMNDMKGKA